jgi:hypothetical protein
MCVYCVLASPRIAQVDPGDEPPSRGGSVTLSLGLPFVILSSSFVLPC